MIGGKFILRYKYISSHYYGLCFRGIARNGLRKGFLGQKLPKEGVFSVRKHCGHVREHRFVRVFTKITKKLWADGVGSDPHIPPLATPLSKIDLKM